MPVIVVNDTMTKYLFDNRYGTGQSAWDEINRTKNFLVAGKNVLSQVMVGAVAGLQYELQASEQV